MPRNVNGELFFTVISKELNPEMRDTSLGNGQGGHFGWPFFKFQKNLILSKRGQGFIFSINLNILFIDFFTLTLALTPRLGLEGGF